MRLMTCSRCENTTTDFAPSTGKGGYCRPCHREYAKAYYQKNRDKRRAQMRQYGRTQRDELQRLRELVEKAGLT